MNKLPLDIDELLKDPNKGLHSTKGIGGILARLWRIVMRDINLKPARFEYLCAQFVARARKGVVDSRVANYFNRGNLRRELAKPTMTFKVFIKALKVLDVLSMTINIELKHSSGRVSIHQVEVDITKAEDLEYEPEE